MITYCPRCGTPYPERFLGEVQDTSRRCVDCALSVTEEPAMLAPGNEEDEVQYDLAEWEVHERTAATEALLEVDIPYRWEADLVLAVPAVAEIEVDQLLDDLDPVSDDDGGDDEEVEDGGEEAHEAMIELFVAADRLQHAPGDGDIAADVLIAAGTVGVSAPPYGIERPVWKRIQDLAATVATDLEETADEDTVAADARALREFLRDLV
jgi:hypothetical protein